MRTFIKSCFSVAAAGLLAISLHAGAAESSKDKNNDPVKQCQAECRDIKNNAEYEGCLLKCKESFQSKTPTHPTIKK
jgi:hypothetical protein